MIPGGLSPTDRPMAERELPTGAPHGTRNNTKAVWLSLALVLLAIAAVVVLLSFIPDA